MLYLLIRHKVKSYAKWKPIFDEHGTARRDNGSKGGQLFRDPNNPNDITVRLEWDDLAKARKFAKSADLRKTMQRAGVIGKPDLYFLEKVEQVAV